MAMTKKDQDALAAAGKAWTEANARGDKAGMEAAHKQAESIRGGYGYSRPAAREAAPAGTRPGGSMWAWEPGTSTTGTRWA